jgi:hypothetical protein
LLVDTFWPGTLSRYAGIQAETVAAALLALCLDQARHGVFRHHNKALVSLASTGP